MKFERSIRATALGLLAALAAAGAAQAQGDWHPSASITPIYVGNAGIDGGGDYSMAGAIVRAGVTRSIGGPNLAGVTFNYDYLDYSFSNPAAFGGVAPWNVVQRYGVAAPLMFGVSEGWLLTVIPSVDWFRENGAAEGDSLTFGAVLSATRFFADGNRLGLGNAREQGLAERVVFTQAPAESLPVEPGYDLVTTFDVIHDLPDPLGVMRRIREALADGGTYLMVEPKVDDTLEGNRGNPFAKMMFAISCLHCVPQSLAQGGSGLGACWGPGRAKQMALDAGFGRFETLPVRSPAMAFYALRP